MQLSFAHMEAPQVCVSAAPPHRLLWRSARIDHSQPLCFSNCFSGSAVTVNIVCVQVERVRNELTKRITELESALAAERASRSDSGALAFEIESYKTQIANYANEVSNWSSSYVRVLTRLIA